MNFYEFFQKAKHLLISGCRATTGISEGMNLCFVGDITGLSVYVTSTHQLSVGPHNHFVSATSITEPPAFSYLPTRSALFFNNVLKHALPKLCYK